MARLMSYSNFIESDEIFTPNNFIIGKFLPWTFEVDIKDYDLMEDFFLNYGHRSDAMITEGSTFTNTLTLTINQTKTIVFTFIGSYGSATDDDYGELRCDGEFCKSCRWSDHMVTTPNAYIIIDTPGKITGISVSGQGFEEYGIDIILPQLSTWLEFTVVQLQSIFDHSLSGKLYELSRKIKRKNEEADYYISLADTIVKPDCTIHCPVTGITHGDTLSCSLVGNLLHIYVSLTLTSAAQTTIGTGNVTNRVICNIFFNDIYSDSKKAEGINNSITVGHGSAYSAGNAQPASFRTITRKPSTWTANTAYSSGTTVVANSKFYQCSTAHTSGSSFATTNWTQITTPSGTSISTDTLIAQIEIDAVVTSTTNYRLYIDIPVTRKPFQG